MAAEFGVEAAVRWSVSVAAGADHLMVFYTCPTCRRAQQINLQPPTPDEPVTSEVWCHLCQKGSPVTVSAGRD